MTKPFQVITDLARAVEAPDDGTLSRTIHQDDNLKAVLFGFAPGQELSEHTAATPAIMHFISGEADVTVGAEHFTAAPGCWVHMLPQTPHSIHAKTQVVMLLLLLKSGAANR
jgi:quercetin dioxygenase-like cupin family protein